MRFQGHSVLITGAASGFGELAAERFAADGARLVLADIDGDGLAKTAAALRAGGAQVIDQQADVSVEADQARLVAAALDQYGALDIALNNAGAAHPLAPITAIDGAVFDRMMAVNARGVFLGLKHQLPPMIAAGSGVVLNTASAAGLVGAGMLSAYAAAKHAIVGLTRSAADEVARHGVRVNAICPAFAATPLYSAIADDLADRRGEDRASADQRIAGRVPMRRVAETREIVDAMLWLCTAENSFMTGQAIAVDGGLTAV